MIADWNGDTYLRTTVHFHKTYRKFCQNAVKEYHFTPGEIDVITFLSNNPGLDTAAEISQYKNISRPLVCRSADSLTRRGFLSPVTDERDRRIVHLHLTEKSAEISGRLRACRTEFFRRLTEGIPPEQLDALQEVLALMQDNLRHLSVPDGPTEEPGKASAHKSHGKDGINYES